MINAIDFSQVFAKKAETKNPKSTKVAISLIRILDSINSTQFNSIKWRVYFYRKSTVAIVFILASPSSKFFFLVCFVLGNPPTNLAPPKKLMNIEEFLACVCMSVF